MTEQTYGSTGPTGSPGSTSEVAKDQARSVAQDAKQSGQQVAATAKDQTREVAGEAKAQAQDLYRQVRGEAADQAAAQQKRAAGGLHALGEELGAMADHSGGSGIAGELARQASDQVRSVATWLESREPGDVMSEVAGFARRRPGTFLAAAAAVGFFGGRLTRGLVADSAEDSGSSVTSPGSGSQVREASAWTEPSPGTVPVPQERAPGGDVLGGPSSTPSMPGLP